MRAIAKMPLAAATISALVLAGCLEDLTSVLPDDMYEPNDSIDQLLDGGGGNAKAELTTEPGPGVWLGDYWGETANVTILDDTDYFEIELAAGGTLTVECKFAAPAGDLDISLWDATKSEVSNPGDVTVEPLLPGKALTVSGLAAGFYYVKITLLSGDANTYDLMWSVVP